MFKICMMGGGGFNTREVVKDIIAVKEFHNTVEIMLFDINPERLERMRRLIQRDLDFCEVRNPLNITTDSREAFRDAKYICNYTRIGGVAAFEKDITIPLQYGVDQCCGDTLGPGGIMYGQRGIAVMLAYCQEIREVARPDVLFLNFGNPNAMMTWAINKYGQVPCIGLCHGVQHSAAQIEKALCIPENELDYICAGVNHQTWFIQLKHKGREITTEELLEAYEKHEWYSVSEKCRIDLMKRFGYYATEANGFSTEYLPWYRKRKDDVLNWVYPHWWETGESGGYLRETIEQGMRSEEIYRELWEGGPRRFDLEEMTNEHCVHIIRGLETGYPYRGHFNVPNRGCITNLPDDAVVEVPCYVDANGVSVPRVGDLPLGCAAVCNASVSVQRLAVEAAVTGDDQLLRQAFMMDPLTGAVCNPPEIWQLVDEMLVAEEWWLPQYAEAIAAAKERLSHPENLIPVDREYKGAARSETRTYTF